MLYALVVFVRATIYIYMQSNEMNSKVLLDDCIRYHDLAWIFVCNSINTVFLETSGAISMIHFDLAKMFNHIRNVVVRFVTFVTCCVELADFCASRDCCCVWFLAADDDIVSHVSDMLLAADALAVFDDVSHLSGAFDWPCSDGATFVRLTDDIEKVQPKWQCWSRWRCWKICSAKFRALFVHSLSNYGRTEFLITF